ncbi:Gibberellin receptor gid1c [Thalictrum thalictroides]|uniref:Gibberellin receptor gid1c n=1 Tax=Thalictrum thalictroides TaxID=46969 RepID=A0A7J6WBA6_THATH|nr:Gibberellin receptor gid1c [Thalictrum thalictroides]
MAEKKALSSKVIPWKVRISLSFLRGLTDFSRRSDGTVNRRLMNLFESAVKVPPQSGKGIAVSDITIDSTRNLWFRLFHPTDVSDDLKLPVLVFFHGGGFTWFSPDVKPYDAMCRQFAQRIPAIVVSVNYRLTPEYHFPAQYDDGFDTLKFLDQKFFDSFPTNANLSQCFLAGDSAGGNIAHHVARRFAEAEREFSNIKVVGLIAIQPYFGGEERTDSEIQLKGVPLISVERSDWHWKVFVPEGANRDHEAVNIFGPKSDDISGLKNFPSTLVFVGGSDPLKDWQKCYFHGLKRSGKEAQLIEYPNAFHAFYIFPEIPEASLLLTEVTVFINNNGGTTK